jgi:hypothetical protein
MDQIRQGLGEILESENYTNLRRNVTWVEFLLERSDMAWRSGDPSTAQADLSAAIALLGTMLQADSSAGPFMEVLVRARFQLWQQQGKDLFAEGAFALVDRDLDEADQACHTRANRVRQAILSGDGGTARSLTTDLLGSGYFEPRFVRLCNRYQLCASGAGANDG